MKEYYKVSNKYFVWIYCEWYLDANVRDNNNSDIRRDRGILILIHGDHSSGYIKYDILSCIYRWHIIVSIHSVQIIPLLQFLSLLPSLLFVLPIFLLSLKHIWFFPFVLFDQLLLLFVYLIFYIINIFIKRLFILYSL